MVEVKVNNGLLPRILIPFHCLMSLGVALLPFVDEKRLLTSLAKVYPDLTEEESKNRIT